VATIIICQISHLRPQNNMLFQVHFGLFLLSLGIPPRAIEIFSQLGLCPSVATLRDTCENLAEERIEIARAIVLSGAFGINWDNLQV
ncbi:hypothetical protein CONPUDRAFT_34611, partial [Coniophora puteana RWD-64-598 SS2]